MTDRYDSPPLHRIKLGRVACFALTRSSLLHCHILPGISIMSLAESSAEIFVAESCNAVYVVMLELDACHMESCCPSFFDTSSSKRCSVPS